MDYSLMITGHDSRKDHWFEASLLEGFIVQWYIIIFCWKDFSYEKLKYAILLINV